MTQPKKLPGAGPASEARDQADAYDSIFANIEIELDTGDIMLIPPHPDMGMLDDDRLEAYTDLLFERDTEYAREPDVEIPEQERDGVLHPKETIRGNFLIPYRWAESGIDIFGEKHKKGERVKPSWSIRVAQICLGEAEYRKLRAGGRSAKDVWQNWTKRGLEVAERRGRSLSDGGPVAVDPVSAPDSQ